MSIDNPSDDAPRPPAERRFPRRHGPRAGADPAMKKQEEPAEIVPHETGNGNGQPPEPAAAPIVEEAPAQAAVPTQHQPQQQGHQQNFRQQRRSMFDMAKLDLETLSDLRERAEDMGLAGYTRLKKDDLIIQLLRTQAERNGLELRGGVLDIVDDGIGFLRADTTCPARRTSMFARRRSALRPAHRRHGRSARCARPRTARSITACCASRRSMASIPKRPRIGRTSRS